MTRGLIAAVVCVLSVAPALVAQGRRGGRGNGQGGSGTPAEPTEEGIPVTDTLTISRCSGCHTKDAKGNLSRISWIRTTPEGWEEAIKRMVRLNGVRLEPADAKAILKYLSNYHGLAPEEAKPVMYMAEHRIQDEVIPNESMRVHLHELPRAGPRVSVAAAARGMVAAGRHALGVVPAGRSRLPARCFRRWRCAQRQRKVAAVGEEAERRQRAAPAEPRFARHDARFSGEGLSAAHAGMGRLAGAHARSAHCRQVACLGTRSGPRQILLAK